MEELLKPVCTSYRNTLQDAPNHLAVSSTEGNQTTCPIFVATPEDALDILRNEPSYEALITTLAYLCKKNAKFSISIPSPISAQLIHILVSAIVPTFWGVLTGRDDLSNSEKKFRGEPSVELQLLISCLQNVTGLNSVITCLKQFIRDSQDSSRPIQSPYTPEFVRIWLSLLEVLLGDEDLFKNIRGSVNQNNGNSVGNILWKEFLKIIGTGKIVGICAEAEKYAQDQSSSISEKHWVAEGMKYSIWLAGNIARWTKNPLDGSETCIKDSSELLSRSLSLGYNETFMKEFVNILLQEDDSFSQFSKVFSGLRNSEQRKIIYTVLKICGTEYLSSTVNTSEISSWWVLDASLVSAIAALISAIISESGENKSHLVTWLSSSTGAGIGFGVAIRRSVMAVIADDRACLEKTFESSLQQFGDRPYIRHTPTLQQDVHCQVLLLAAGYIHRKSPNTMKIMTRSGSYLSSISNRLSSSSPRIRFLGMVVGEALSSLVDKEENKIDFKVPDLNTPEAKWLKSLVEVSDSVGSFDLLKSKKIIQVSFRNNSDPYLKPVTTKASIAKDPTVKTTEPKKIIQKASENDDLIPYSKPDSDVEDSDDDPTIVNRNKLTAPVYIRDLITYLRDTESFDRQKLALSTAAQLIRRKANFGTEVIDHAEELATLLVGIQDKYEIENFADLRLQGMIAILVAAPSKMGQWFSNTFFSGDYSISQRSSILTTLGLGAREIGGYGAEDAMLSSHQVTTDLFPSKKLPVGMEKYYAPDSSTRVDALSSHLAKTMITPMAVSLADKLTGPSILKVRTFSSRMEVQKKSSKPTSNPLSKIVGESFVFPLTGRFLLHFNSCSISSRSVVFQPFLLSHFIKTLSLIIHAGGPSTPSLPQMTTEFWDLLLKLKAPAKEERIVCEALCFALLTILELNADKVGLVQAHGQQLLETQEWIRIVLELVGEGDEDERCRMLAAGCLVRIQGLVENHQRVLMGYL